MASSKQYCVSKQVSGVYSVHCSSLDNEGDTILKQNMHGQGVFVHLEIFKGENSDPLSR